VFVCKFVVRVCVCVLLHAAERLFEVCVRVIVCVCVCVCYEGVCCVCVCVSCGKIIS